jgi:predicted nuclease of predicted toxin-antitoxin system
MKFLADENISNNVVNNLKTKGLDITSIKETKVGLSDEAVLEIANTQERILITFDSDFGELIFKRKINSKGVILLKFVPQSNDQISKIISNVLFSRVQLAGNFVIVTEKRLRVIRLK